MYNIYFAYSAENDIKKFVSNLKKYYFNLYTDTGLLSESMIIDNYYQNFDKLVSFIRQKIEESGTNGLIGRKIIEVIDNQENMFE